MKPLYRVALAVAVLATGLTCNALTGTPATQPAAVDFTLSEGRLQEIMEMDSDWGKLFDIDTNQDGTVDEAIYRFPNQEIETDVTLLTTLIYSSGETTETPDPTVYYKAMYLEVFNYGEAEKQVQFNLEIPKSFAQSVDELDFNPQPAAIVNPDPVVMYDIVLPAPPVDESTLIGMPVYVGYAFAQSMVNFEAARKKLREDALAQMREKCKSAPVDQKSYCYLSLVSDFHDLLNSKDMESICNGETTGFARRVCLSVAKNSAAECDRASTPEDVLVCKGFYVNHKCKGLDGGELQACLRDTSLANKAPLGCMDLEEPDVKNDCYARAGNNAAYCQEINNTARREACEKALNQTVQSDSEPVAADPSDWFTPQKSKTDCKPFAALFPEYTLSFTDGEYFNDVAKLSCDMDANGEKLNDILYEVVVWVWAYESSEASRYIWENELKDGYTLLAMKNLASSNTDPDTQFTFEADRYFQVSKMTTFDGTIKYSIVAGAVYRNAHIAFQFDGYDGSTAYWQQVEALFKQLIDSKLR
jgi:hypothetical protein